MLFRYEDFRGHILTCMAACIETGFTVQHLLPIFQSNKIGMKFVFSMHAKNKFHAIEFKIYLLRVISLCQL